MTTVLDVQRFKYESRRFTMLTAYDFLSAQILDQAGIPILLVGDSLGMVMLGYPTTLPVTMDEMIHHAKAVSRGARQALLVGDMPFMSYHSSTEQAIESAGRFIKEGGMHGALSAALDITEVDANADVSGMTVRLAAAVFLTVVSAVAQRRGAVTS